MYILHKMLIYQLWYQEHNLSADEINRDGEETTTRSTIRETDAEKIGEHPWQSLIC